MYVARWYAKGGSCYDIFTGETYVTSKSNPAKWFDINPEDRVPGTGCIVYQYSGNVRPHRTLPIQKAAELLASTDQGLLRGGLLDRRLVLGGVEIPFERGLLGHSDADVLTHAVMDAGNIRSQLRPLGNHRRVHVADTPPELPEISVLCGQRKIPGWYAGQGAESWGAGRKKMGVLLQHRHGHHRTDESVR